MAERPPLSKRLVTTGGYATAALLIAAASPVVRRRPVHVATAKAYRQVATARSGLDLWLDVRATPPLSLGDLLLESLLGAMADRPSSPSAPR